MTRSIVRLGPAVATVAVLLVGCGPQTAQQLFQQPTCDGANSSVVLIAQSVPSASLVPCIGTFPSGWSFNSQQVRNGSARFWLDSDRAGMKALEVELAGSCRPRGTPSPTDKPGTRMFVEIRRFADRVQGSRYYVFPGGCLIYDFDYPQQGSAVYYTDSSNAVRLFRRSELNADLVKIGIHP